MNIPPILYVKEPRFKRVNKQTTVTAVVKLVELGLTYRPLLLPHLTAFPCWQSLTAFMYSTERKERRAYLLPAGSHVAQIQPDRLQLKNDNGDHNELVVIRQDNTEKQKTNKNLC